MRDQARQDGFDGRMPHEACASPKALCSAFPPSFFVQSAADG